VVPVAEDDGSVDGGIDCEGLGEIAVAPAPVGAGGPPDVHAAMDAATNAVPAAASVRLANRRTVRTLIRPFRTATRGTA
jgi:hypothetical protein